MSQPTEPAPSDPQQVIGQLRALSAQFRAEGAALAAAEATSGTADDGLTTITVDLTGEITALTFSPALAGATPAGLAASVEATYAEAIHDADARLGREGPPTEPATAPVDTAEPPGLGDVLERLVSIDQWGGAAVLAHSPYADAELDRDAANFNEVIAAKVTRVARAFEEAKADLAQVVGHAESEATLVDTDPSGDITSIRFTVAAPRTEPGELAADVLATITAARADAERQRVELLSDTTGR